MIEKRVPIEKIFEKNENTKLREQMIEYRFLSDIIICSAGFGQRIEVARSDQDLFGYDVILKVGNTVKYVQLKGRKKTGKNTRWDIHKSLIKEKNGTVILITIDYNSKDFTYEYYILDELKKESILLRPSFRKKGDNSLTKLSDFIKCKNIEDVYKHLFL